MVQHDIPGGQKHKDWSKYEKYRFQVVHIHYRIHTEGKK